MEKDCGVVLKRSIFQESPQLPHRGLVQRPAGARRSRKAPLVNICLCHSFYFKEKIS